MTGKVSVKNTVDIKRWVTTLKAEQKKKLGRAMEEAAREIVERTRSGKDIGGNAFADYTQAYALKKAGSGRGAKWVGAAKGRSKRATGIRKGLVKRAGIKLKPDLTYSGKMLANIRTKIWEHADKLVGIIFFASQLEASKAEGNQAKRPFFGLSQSQIAKIKTKLK